MVPTIKTVNVWLTIFSLRAHDTEAQTIIQRIIRDRINPNLFGYNFTRDEIKKAFEIYNEDIDKAHKTYASYNLPSVYALMLTNKDSVTRVYYGDLYREDGHYMAKKTPYFDAIDTLLRARIKYVAGGQDMEVKKVGNALLLLLVKVPIIELSIGNRTQGMVVKTWKLRKSEMTDS